MVPLRIIRNSHLYKTLFWTVGTQRVYLDAGGDAHINSIFNYPQLSNHGIWRFYDNLLSYWREGSCCNVLLTDGQLCIQIGCFSRETRRWCIPSFVYPPITREFCKQEEYKDTNHKLSIGIIMKFIILNPM